jgi:hypothetical protein
VLDQLHFDGTRPEITSTADAILRESGSSYTLPGLISALDEVISQLTRATPRHRRHQPARPPAPGQILTTGGKWSQIKVATPSRNSSQVGPDQKRTAEPHD